MSGERSPVLVVSGPSGVGKSTASAAVARAFDPSVHIRADDFVSFVVNGWVEWEDQAAAHQYEVVGGAFALAAMHFAEGGYTVVLDGHLFPDGVRGLALGCAHRGIPLHYAVLRADLATCLARADAGASAVGADPAGLARVHGRFADLGDLEAHVVDASGTEQEVADALLAAFRADSLALVHG